MSRTLSSSHRNLLILILNRFNGIAQGCRHWCATVLEKLALGGYVDSNISRAYALHEIASSQKYGEMFPMPRIKGIFRPLEQAVRRKRFFV